MKKITILICVIAVAITLNSCEPTKYYACCDTGHAHWEGSHTDSGTQANQQAYDHDNFIHGGVKTAGVCTTR